MPIAMLSAGVIRQGLDPGLVCGSDVLINMYQFWIFCTWSQEQSKADYRENDESFRIRGEEGKKWNEEYEGLGEGVHEGRTQWMTEKV